MSPARKRGSLSSGMNTLGRPRSIWCSEVVPLFGAPTMKKSGTLLRETSPAADDAAGMVICAEATGRDPRPQACAASSLALARRHSQRAVETDGLAVEHAVLDDVACQLRVLGGLAQARRVGDTRA